MKTLLIEQLETVRGGFEPLTMPPGWDPMQAALEQQIEEFFLWWLTQQQQQQVA